MSYETLTIVQFHCYLLVLPSHYRSGNRYEGKWREGREGKDEALSALHYGFCPLVKFSYKDLAKLSALAAIFKTKSYFR